MRVGDKRTVARHSGRFEIELDVALAEGAQAEVTVTAEARAAEGDDKRELSLIIDRIEFA